MTLDRWIALLSSLAALGATAIALLTLFEMRRQRRGQNLVNLFLPSLRWEVGLSGNPSTKMGFRTSATKPKGDDEFVNAFVWAEILNLGRSPAITVDVKCYYQLEKIHELLKKYRDGRQLEVFETNSKFVIFKTGGSTIPINRELDGVSVFDFLTPFEGNKTSGVAFRLPDGYILLFVEYLGLFREMLLSAGESAKSSFSKEVTGLFELTIVAKYKDVEGRNYKCEFRGHPEIFAFPNEGAEGFWNFKRTN